MMYIFFGSDESVTKIDNINDVNSMDDLLAHCRANFNIAKDDLSRYGLKTKVQGIFITDVAQINDQPVVTNDNEFLNDKVYINDEMVKQDALKNGLVCIDMHKEA